MDVHVGVDDFGKVYMLMYMKVEGRILMDVHVDNYCMYIYVLYIRFYIVDSERVKNLALKNAQDAYDKHQEKV